MHVGPWFGSSSPLLSHALTFALLALNCPAWIRGHPDLLICIHLHFWVLENPSFPAAQSKSFCHLILAAQLAKLKNLMGSMQRCSSAQPPCRGLPSPRRLKGPQSAPVNVDRPGASGCCFGRALDKDQACWEDTAVFIKWVLLHSSAVCPRWHGWEQAFQQCWHSQLGQAPPQQHRALLHASISQGAFNAAVVLVEININITQWVCHKPNVV